MEATDAIWLILCALASVLGYWLGLRASVGKWIQSAVAVQALVERIGSLESELGTIKASQGGGGAENQADEKTVG